MNLDIPVTLTQKSKKDLGQNFQQLSVDIDKTTSWRMSRKKPENDHVQG